MDNKYKKVFDLIDKFYDIKGYYDFKMEQKKKTPKYKKANKTEKQKMVKDWEDNIKCLLCGCSGGIIFIEDNDFLEAMCNCKKKCEFHIKIKLGKRKNFQKYKQELKTEIEDLKFKIMKLKLDLLFELEKESVILAEFSVIKDKLEEKQNILSQMQQEYNKQFVVEEELESEKILLEGNTNPTTMKESRKKIIKDLDIRIKNEVNYYSKILNEYKKTTINETQIDKNLLKDALNVYIDTIIPLMEKKHEISFQLYEINLILEGSKNPIKYKVYKKFISDINKEVKVGKHDYKILINKGMDFSKKKFTPKPKIDDHYKILGVSRNATMADIKKAYKKAALKYHPDKQKNKNEKEKAIAEEKFKKVANSAEILTSPTKKEEYDRMMN